MPIPNIFAQIYKILSQGFLTFTTLRVISADEKLMVFFLFFTLGTICMNLKSCFGDNLHEMSNHVFLEKKIRKIFQYVVC